VHGQRPSRTAPRAHRPGPAADPVFTYSRRVQFAETDPAGIVHFSWMFRYMEEAEHALWRAAGLSIAERGSDIGWPRVAASFEFRHPLHFEDLVDVRVRLAGSTTRTLKYEHTLMRGETLIGSGTMIVVCVRTLAGGRMRSAELPDGLVARLIAAAAASGRETR
jgi:YbgC/YbaW family acyl-CoA thioester hydrolase